mmetsp:Transcript_55263/g.179167  ORF Transcript_55263/g.179167 Transcript_55263/m.179167 type:complete len:678 (-) Transcript_55263:165-2198(-)
MDLAEQRARLRPQSAPGPQQLRWAEDLLADKGRLALQAAALIRRHAPDGSKAVAPGQGLEAIGSELDAKLGLCGSLSSLLCRLSASGCSEFAADSLAEALEELMLHARRKFGRALRRSSAAVQRSGLVRDFYDLGESWGSGAFAKVYVATDRTTKVNRAVKVVSRKGLSISTSRQILREVEHLSSLDHPHIVKLHEHFENNGLIFLCLELCPGGSIEELVTDCRSVGRRFPQRFSLDVAAQVLEALVHMHSLGLIHRDVKPSNVMLSTNHQQQLLPLTLGGGDVLAIPPLCGQPHAMLIDFGLTQHFQPGNFRHKAPMGTPYSMAPELWQGTVTPKVDIFGSGVVLLELLSAPRELPPFPRACGNDFELEAQESRRYWSNLRAVLEDLLDGVSPPAVVLVRNLLELDRRRRPTAAESLQSTAFRPVDGESDSAVSSRELAGTLDRIVRASRRSLLTHSLALSVASRLPARDLSGVARAFKHLDRHGNCRLDKACVREALRKHGVDAEEAHVAAESLDLSCCGTIRWTDFVAACLDFNSESCRDILQHIFSTADRSGNGQVSLWAMTELLAAEHLPCATALHHYLDDTSAADLEATIDWPTFYNKISVAGCLDVAKVWRQTLWLESARDLLFQALSSVWTGGGGVDMMQPLGCFSDRTSAHQGTCQGVSIEPECVYIA